MEIIKTKNLTKIYKAGKTEVVAIKNINLKITHGEFTAITGPSGSGKTTLLNLLGGIDTITSGEIYFENKRLNDFDKKALTNLRREKIGFIFQTFNLIPVLTAFENVAFPLYLLKKDENTIKSRVYELLEKVGLKGLERRKPTELSGGQQQRIAIARALVKNPLIVFADEPTANLDSKTGKEILKLMKKLNKDEKVTFVFSTHDPMVMKFARRIIKLHDGKIVK